MTQSPSARPEQLSPWAHARIQTTKLPSGAGDVDVEMLDLTEALIYDRIPNPLRAVAIRAETSIISEDKLSDDERKEYFHFRCWVVADGVKEFRPTKGDPIAGPLDPEWVAREMPPSDRDTIWGVRMHVLSPEAAQRFMTLLDVAPFRDGGSGTGTGSSGEQDGETSE